MRANNPSAKPAAYWLRQTQRASVQPLARFRFSRTRRSRSIRSKAGFTLIELLTVLVIIAVVASLVAPSFVGMKGGQDFTRGVYVVSGALEQARSYAMANNTYVWVGLFEEDGSKNSTTPATTGNGGRLIILMVASQDGTRYSDTTIDGTSPGAFGAGTASNAVTLTQINPIIKVDDIHLAAVNSGTNTNNIPARPAVPTAYQAGDAPGGAPHNATGAFALHVGSISNNPTTFTYPLTVVGVSQTTQYTFSKIIEFNPQGEVSKIAENVFTGPGPQSAIELALQPTHGSTLSPLYTGANQNNAGAAIQIQGITGQVRVYRP